MNVGDWIKKWSEIAPTKVAIIENEVEITYGELNERVNCVCSYLLRKGVAKGDRVAIISFNSHEFMEVYFAAAKTGAVVVPINWRMAPDEIAYILNDCTPNLSFSCKTSWIQFLH